MKLRESANFQPGAIMGLIKRVRMTKGDSSCQVNDDKDVIKSFEELGFVASAVETEAGSNKFQANPKSKPAKKKKVVKKET